MQTRQQRVAVHVDGAFTVHDLDQDVDDKVLREWAAADLSVRRPISLPPV